MKTQLSSTNTFAFYNKEEAQEHMINETNKDTIVGLDISIEETEMEDVRTSAKLNVYTVTSFHDLTKVR